jgi:hypothetical protein
MDYSQRSSEQRLLASLENNVSPSTRAAMKHRALNDETDRAVCVSGSGFNKQHAPSTAAPSAAKTQ